MVDPEHVLFRKGRVQHLVEGLGAGHISPERLLDDEPAVLGAARFAEVRNDDRKEARRDREVEDRPPGAAEPPAQLFERHDVVVVAGDVVEQLGQHTERALVANTAAEGFDAFSRPVAQLLNGPRRRGHADHRHVEHTALRHVVQRRKDLLAREIAGDAEEHQRIRSRASCQWGSDSSSP